MTGMYKIYVSASGRCGASTRHVLRLLGFAAGVMCLLQADESLAGSTAALVDAGNRAFQAGKFDEAISAYDKASVQAPESPVIFFNKGDALYRKGDYAGASEMFEKAAIKSKALKLEASARYNLGNCAFREAEKQKDSDLQKALAACQSSVKSYQDALKLDPDHKDAARNIEIVRLTIKAILDEIKKKQEEAEKQKQQQKDAAERMKQLIQKQEQAAEKSKSLSKEKQAQGDSQDVQKKSQELADEQKNIQKETEKLSEEMKEASQQQKQGQPQNQPDAGKKAAEHLDEAKSHQGKAADKLKENSPEQAQPEQGEASKDLKEALKSLEDDSKKGGNDQNQQKPQDQKDQQDKQTQQQDQPQASEQDKPGQQQQASKVDEDVRDVLNDEKTNKEMRDRRSMAPYGEVDKDW